MEITRRKKTPIQFIPIDKRIEYLIESIFGSSENPIDIDEILSSIYISLKGTYLPDNQEIMDVLERIGEPIQEDKIFKWQRKSLRITTLEQYAVEEIVKKEKVEVCWEHLRLIKQVAEFGIDLGYHTWIGLTEQKKDKRIREWVTLNSLEIPNISERTLKRIAEIDTIWFDDDNLDKFIEVEEYNYDKCITRITNIFQERLPEEILPDNLKILFIIKDGREKQFIRAMNEPSIKGLILDKIKRPIYYIPFSKFLKIKDEMEYSKISQEDLIFECNKFEASLLIT